MNSTKPRNTTLDILKAVCCVLVVFIHCKFPSIVGTIVESYARICVPIFFMISGYFVANNDLVNV